jgi:hypothetical protein
MKNENITVKDFINILSQFDPNRILIMSKDGEGNSYSPLCSAWEASYLPNNAWCGDIGLEKLTPKDKELGYTDEDVVNGIPCIVLSPIN